MYLSRIQIKNYRGIRELEVAFAPDINVIIGENGCCKSALIDAIRLLYSLGEPMRDISVQFEDFYECSHKYEDATSFTRASQVEITYEFRNLSNLQKGAFYEYLVLNGEDEYACVTLKYEDKGKAYPYFSYSTGATESQRADYNTFSLFQHYYLSALRDSTHDLMTTKNNLLGKVIKRQIERKKSEEEIRTIIQHANNELLERPEVKNTRDGINTNLEQIFKQHVANLIGLQIEQGKIEYIVNVIKPYLPHGKDINCTDGFRLWQNSLGFNNLIYIATVLGDIKDRIKDDNISHYALLIEEPEAHLHPQLQLNLFNFLTEANKDYDSQLFITTHSPTLTSKVPFKNLILLNHRSYLITNCFTNRVKENIAQNASSVKSPLSDNDFKRSQKMLERYIDVTRSQLFYAKSCLLVEGISEELLISSFCKVLGFSLTDYQIEVINVNGTSFYPFMYLFNSSDIKKRLPQKISILTDDDRFPDSKKTEYNLEKLSENDFELLDILYKNIENDSMSSRIKNLYSLRNEQDNIGIYTAYKTFEYEICLANVDKQVIANKNGFLYKYIKEISTPNSINILEKYLESFESDNLNDPEMKKLAILLWKSLPPKAEFAQNLATYILENLSEAKENFKIPKYINLSLTHLQ